MPPRMAVVAVVVAIAGPLGFAACGDDQPSTPSGPTSPQQPTLSGLSIRSEETTLSVGDTLTVTACARYSNGSENCSIQALWQSLQPEVAAVENNIVTALAPGQATIQASYQSHTATLEITVEAVEPTFAFDPVPPATINEGDTGHFRVNIEAGSRQRLTTGVTSSAESVVRVNLEGDRWRYTGVSAGRAEIRVVHNDERRLTHTMTVEGPDYEIVDVNRYDASTALYPHYSFWTTPARARLPMR